jgi:hypothetical protein
MSHPQHPYRISCGASRQSEVTRPTDRQLLTRLEIRRPAITASRNPRSQDCKSAWPDYECAGKHSICEPPPPSRVRLLVPVALGVKSRCRRSRSLVRPLESGKLREDYSVYVRSSLIRALPTTTRRQCPMEFRKSYLIGRQTALE